jgi:hypothetical protein
MQRSLGSRDIRVFHTLVAKSPAHWPGFFVLRFWRGFRGLPSFNCSLRTGRIFNMRSKPSSRRSSSDFSRGALSTAIRPHNNACVPSRTQTDSKFCESGRRVPSKPPTHSQNRPVSIPGQARPFHKDGLLPTRRGPNPPPSSFQAPSIRARAGTGVGCAPVKLSPKSSILFRST